MLYLSIIICTHNPRLNYLNRVIEGLKSQTLPYDQWELLLIDNCSTSSIQELIDLSWHPSSRFINEDIIGLTPARIRGINESKGDILVFVDDDNYLNRNYLQILAQQMQHVPILGALGAGKILPEFEIPPSSEVLPFLKMLALRDEARAHFSNEVGWHIAIPFGAGLGIRRSIALVYVDACKARVAATSLDRKGDALLSGGDVDLALHACQENYVVGVIPELELTHFIPASRLELNYLINLAIGHAKSHYMLSRLWNYHSYLPENPILSLVRYWKKRIRSRGLSKRIFIAEHKAIEEARLEWESL